jgi:hypothetical protein
MGSATDTIAGGPNRRIATTVVMSQQYDVDS